MSLPIPNSYNNRSNQNDQEESDDSLDYDQIMEILEKEKQKETIDHRLIPVQQQSCSPSHQIQKDNQQEQSKKQPFSVNTFKLQKPLLNKKSPIIYSTPQKEKNCQSPPKEIPQYCYNERLEQITKKRNIQQNNCGQCTSQIQQQQQYLQQPQEQEQLQQIQQQQQQQQLEQQQQQIQQLQQQQQQQQLEQQQQQIQQLQQQQEPLQQDEQEQIQKKRKRGQKKVDLEEIPIEDLEKEKLENEMYVKYQYTVKKIQKRQIVLDTETTGFFCKNPDYNQNRMVEICAVEMINGKLTGKKYHTYLNPERIISQKSIEIHKITNSFVKDKPKFKEVCQKLMEFIGNSTIIAHNTKFDMNFLNYELSLLNKPQIPQSQSIDTEVLAKQVYPNSKTNLDNLCKALRIDTKSRDNGHGALIDAKLLAHVYCQKFKTFDQMTLNL